ncbi:hypothetical protein N9L06_05445 [Mariniblastus sp.]|nr:hypothetical protein [Mariniblastus sp.]
MELAMQDPTDLILQFGEFSTLVIIACVALVLFISLLEPHPRNSDRYKKSSTTKNPSNESKRR